MKENKTINFIGISLRKVGGNVTTSTYAWSAVVKCVSVQKYHAYPSFDIT